MKQLAKYIFICVFCVITFTSIAQPVSKHDKIDALRVSFITSKVNFTTQESQLFWPLYNEYNDKADALKKHFVSNLLEILIIIQPLIKKLKLI